MATAMRCATCGRAVVHDGSECLCCGSLSVEAVRLAPAGTIESWTRIGDRAVGEIRLDDGVLVLGALAMPTPKVGARVTVNNEQEHEVYESA